MSFVLSKLLWGIVSPGSLLTLLLVVGALAATIPHPRTQRIGRGLCLAVALCMAAIASLPVGEWAMVPLENRIAREMPEQVDGIILLGGDERPDITEARGQPTAQESLRRYVLFTDLSRRYPDAKLIFTGGSPFVRRLTSMAEADVAHDNLAIMGVDVDHMLFEKNSRNTYENALLTADIVRPEPTQKYILVTSAFHMPRALAVFRKAGWNVAPAPAGYYTNGEYRMTLWFSFEEQMRILTTATREYVGLVSYWLMGRIASPWPSA